MLETERDVSQAWWYQTAIHLQRVQDARGARRSTNAHIHQHVRKGRSARHDRMWSRRQETSLGGFGRYVAPNAHMQCFRPRIQAVGEH